MTAKTTHKWKITDFSKTASRDDPELVLKSKVFKLTGCDSKFKLWFRPVNNKRHESKEYSSLYLVPKDLDGAPAISVDYKLWLENTNGDKLPKPGLGTTTYTFDRINTGYGRPGVVHHDRLYSPTADFIKNDTVFVCCEIHLKLTEATIDKLQLGADIDKKEWSFYEKGFVDSCVIQVEGQKFTIDKKKLMAHSIVFEQMFQSGMQETQTGVVKMGDTSPAAIQSLIRYFHVHTIEKSDKMALSLYLLADKYEIADLKAKCSRLLVGKLNKANLLDRLILAFRHNDDVFKRGVIAYLASHSGSFKKIMISAEWKEFTAENCELSTEIIDGVFDAMNWN